jgi:hypothetical protein
VSLSERSDSRGEHRHSTDANTLHVPCTTMDITPVFNQILVQHDTHPVEPYAFRLDDLDEFLKEAYRIVGHVAPRKTADNND